MEFPKIKLVWKIVTAVCILAVIILMIRFLSGPEDTWLCQDGVWVKQGNPGSPRPTLGCGQPNDNGGSNADATPAEIEVYAPANNQIVKSPLTVAGRAKGNWFFEASFPIKLVDGQGKEIAVSYVQSIGDWMTENFVPFSGRLQFSVSATTTGELILHNDNPSGLPLNDKEIRLPVIISPEPALTVRAYFNNANLDPEFSCNKVFPVERQILKTTATARAALEQLLAGPNELDKALGFTTSLNTGVKIQSLVIVAGMAKVDFDDQLEFQVGGSCRVGAIRAQITETLKQFPAVKEVIISVNGRTEDILQP